MILQVSQVSQWASQASPMLQVTSPKYYLHIPNGQDLATSLPFVMLGWMYSMDNLPINKDNSWDRLRQRKNLRTTLQSQGLTIWTFVVWLLLTTKKRSNAQTSQESRKKRFIPSFDDCHYIISELQREKMVLIEISAFLLGLATSLLLVGMASEEEAY